MQTGTPELMCAFDPREYGPETIAVLARYKIPRLEIIYARDVGGPAPGIEFTEAHQLFRMRLREEVRKHPPGSMRILDIEDADHSDLFYLICLADMQYADPTGKFSLYNIPGTQRPTFPPVYHDFFTNQVYIGKWTEARVEFLRDTLIPLASAIGNKPVVLLSWHRRQAGGKGSEGNGEQLEPTEVHEQSAIIRELGGIEAAWGKGEALGSTSWPGPLGDEGIANYMEMLARSHGLVASDTGDTGDVA
ncbi:hypothetical protein LCGC14_0568580 [marine sediment metagenome]|uniref:Uncharacterized protein n=1 Tax=marine sediment metagenome TaxID=412755 RepID=A0A0F9S3I0_9ZZZZ|nr:hypothetical protein [Phycisphaerae bacterium]